MIVDWRLRPGRPVLEFGGDAYVALEAAYEQAGALPAFAASAWVKTTVSGESRSSNWANLDFDRSEYFDLSVRGDDGRVWFATTDDSGSTHDQYSSTSVDDGEWHHLVAVYDGTDKVVYVDGEEDARAADAHGGAPVGTGTTRYGFVGDGSEASTFDGNRNGHGFRGGQDETLLFERALDSSEVERLWHGGLPDTGGLVAHWRFDGEGDTLTDVTGNGNDGHFRGGPEWGAGHTDPDPALVDVEVTDAFNRFARSATAVLDDPDGTVSERYSRPTPVEFEVTRDVDDGYRRRFGGFVVNTTAAEHATELEVLSHDFWLRKRQVFRGFADVPISDVLRELVVDLTPLDWVAGNVSVVHDEAVTRDWKGERLDEVLSELASISADEEFGANDAGEFFFRPREERTAPRNFPAGEYVEADFSEDAKQEVNEVTLYYGEGSNTGAVAVEDRASQKELAQELDRPRPVVVGVTKSFPEITTEAAAERKARQLLHDRDVVQTGTLTTWEAFDVRPGDVTHVVAPEQDVDRDFRVAEITYRWADDETEVQLAENTGGVVDTLVSLSNEVARIDSRAADESATITQFLEFDQALEVALELEAYRRRVPDDQLLFGATKGGWGDPRTGGGLWGDQRGDREQLL